MKISTIEDFCEHTPALLNSTDPVVVTDAGHVTGIFFPFPETSMPVDMKREIFSAVSAAIHREVEAKGLSHDEIEADFEVWRKERKSPNL